MTVWYVHRRKNGDIASAHQEPQLGYAEEAVDENDTALDAILRPARPPKVTLPSSAANSLPALRDDFNTLLTQLKSLGVIP